MADLAVTAVRPPAGLWVPDAAQNTATTTFTNSFLYILPILLGAGTIDRIQINVATAGSAGSIHRLGLYRQAVGDRLGKSSLVVDARTVATDSTGLKAASISQAVVAGIYHIVVAQQGAPSTLAAIRAISGGGVGDFGGLPLVGGGFANGLSAMRATVAVAGALPAGIVAQEEFSSRPWAQVRYS